MDESLQSKTKEARIASSGSSTDIVASQPDIAATKAHRIADKAIDPVKHERNKEELRVKLRRVRLDLKKMRGALEH